MPGIAFGLAGFSESFHDEAYRVGRPVWRVRSAGGQKQNISFADRLALPLAGTVDIFEDDVSFQLIKELVTRIDVEISPRVGAADDHDHELRVFPYHLGPNRRPEQLALLIDPALEIEGAERRLHLS